MWYCHQTWQAPSPLSEGTITSFGVRNIRTGTSVSLLLSILKSFTTHIQQQGREKPFLIVSSNRMTYSYSFMLTPSAVLSKDNGSFQGKWRKPNIEYLGVTEWYCKGSMKFTAHLQNAKIRKKHNLSILQVHLTNVYGNRGPNSFLRAILFGFGVGTRILSPDSSTLSIFPSYCVHW